MAVALSLRNVYEGWDGHQVALVRAVAALTAAQLAWRLAPHLRSVGELVEHIVMGRVNWIHQFLGVESAEVTQWMETWSADDKLKPGVEENVEALVSGLEATWKMIESALPQWTTEDPGKTQRHEFRGTTWVVSRQWILWRIICERVHPILHRHDPFSELRLVRVRHGRDGLFKRGVKGLHTTKTLHWRLHDWC